MLGERGIRGRIIQAVPGLGVAPAQLAGDGLGVRVEHQLVWVEAMPRSGRVGAVYPICVELAGAEVRKVAVPDVVRALREPDAGALAAAPGVEEAELDRLGVLRKEREIDPFTVPCRAERMGAARPDAQRVARGAHPVHPVILVPIRSIPSIRSLWSDRCRSACRRLRSFAG